MGTGTLHTHHAGCAFPGELPVSPLLPLKGQLAARVQIVAGGTSQLFHVDLISYSGYITEYNRKITYMKYRL